MEVIFPLLMIIDLIKVYRIAMPLIHRCPSPIVHSLRDWCTWNQRIREVEVLTSPHLSGGKQVWVSAAASDTDPCKREKFCIYEEPFKQLAASRIDDASHQRAGMNPNAQIGLAWRK